MTIPYLTMERISKRFPGVVANDSVTIEVGRGEILALLGENGAGKSTLMNVLTGILQPDSGTVRLEGRPVNLHSPRAARQAGIGMVHQHFKLVPDMSVLDNIALATFGGGLMLSPNRLRTRLEKTAELYGLNTPLTAPVETLTVGERQRAEILKVLSTDPQILILDEPSAVLDPLEWRRLAAVLKRLAAEGRAIILITHKLAEVFDVAHRCVVLRDGRVVGSVAVGDADKAGLARMMVGRDVVLRAVRERLAPGSAVLELSDLAIHRPGRMGLDHLTLTVHASEVLGIAGVEGNGQSELVDLLSGLLRPTSGSVRVAGQSIDNLSPIDLIGRGLGVIPEDRQRTGLALELPLRENLIMRDLWSSEISRWGLLRRAEIDGRCTRLVGEYDIRTPSTSVRMGQLSGGNQQKAVLARELDRKPRLLVAAQPTRGLDVGAIEFVYSQIAEHKRRGGATVLVSTELDEILSLSDRVAVMVNGRIVGIVDPDEVGAERLGLMMSGAA